MIKIKSYLLFLNMEKLVLFFIFAHLSMAEYNFPSFDRKSAINGVTIESNITKKEFSSLQAYPMTFHSLLELYRGSVTAEKLTSP